MKNASSLRDYTLWSVMCLCLLILSLLAAWHLLATQNFPYRTWYDVLALGENIEEYGPVNVSKKDFHLTDKPQHISLFAGIVDGIQHEPDTLSDIRYLANGQSHQLLHEAELIHLKDVHQLVQQAYRAGAAVLAFMVILAVVLVKLKSPLPDLWRLHLVAALVIAAGAAALALFGAEAVFYQLHIWAFPEGHQWYFFYEESLMSTMMKAPVLFGGIALELVVLALFLYSAALLILKRFWPAAGNEKADNL